MFTVFISTSFSINITAPVLLLESSPQLLYSCKRLFAFSLTTMAIKAFIFLFISLLLVSTRVSSKDGELLEAAYAIVTSRGPLKATFPAAIITVELPPPAPIPVKVPTPAPFPVNVPPPAPLPVKVSPPPAPVQVKVPPPTAHVPVKLPPPPAPPVKPPVLAPPVMPPPTYVPKPPPRNTKECYPPCLVRCKLHSRKNVCLRACVTCCDRCKCVPPGQSGNREKCGKCYVNMTTHGGRPKCP